MSYADSVREELLSAPVKRLCCRKALAFGLLINAETENKLIRVTFRSRATASFAAEILRRQFGKTPDAEDASAHGHQLVHLTFSSPAAMQYLSVIGSIPGVPPQPERTAAEASVALLPAAGQIVEFSCDACRSAFLRGIFLSCATVNDPRKSTHLEFQVCGEGRARFLSEFLVDCGYHPGYIRRPSGVGLYFKNGTSVEELIILAGAGRTAMDIMNIRIERDIRNQENRATNCVAKNIEKSVSATARQMNAIEKLTLTGMLAQLPEGLRLTARLRAENPDASLEELRMLHQPPITKSGLNHRLRKLIEEAEKRQ